MKINRCPTLTAQPESKNEVKLKQTSPSFKAHFKEICGNPNLVHPNVLSQLDPSKTKDVLSVFNELINFYKNTD